MAIGFEISALRLAILTEALRGFTQTPGKCRKSTWNKVTILFFQIPFNPLGTFINKHIISVWVTDSAVKYSTNK
jgi:hypothetical protein